jgi:hypothetical protein
MLYRRAAVVIVGRIRIALQIESREQPGALPNPKSCCT